jgi:hypothetical protein
MTPTAFLFHAPPAAGPLCLLPLISPLKLSAPRHLRSDRAFLWHVSGPFHAAPGQRAKSRTVPSRRLHVCPLAWPNAARHFQEEIGGVTSFVVFMRTVPGSEGPPRCESRHHGPSTELGGYR